VANSEWKEPASRFTCRFATAMSANVEPAACSRFTQGFREKRCTSKGKGRSSFVPTNEGAKCRFSFCATCGSTVFYVEESQEQHVAIPVGGFADPAFPAPTVLVYEESRHSWVAMSDEMVHRSQA